jgi:hypothetical protein
LLLPTFSSSHAEEEAGRPDLFPPGPAQKNGGGGARTLIKYSFAGVIPEVARALPKKCTGIGNQ